LATDICICNTVSRKIYTIKLVYVILLLWSVINTVDTIFILWNMTTCSLAKIYGRVGRTHVNHYQTSRRHIPECCVRIHRCEKLQSRTVCRPVTEVSDVRTDQQEACRINNEFPV